MWYGIQMDDRVVMKAFGNVSEPATVIHRYATDKNRIRVRKDDGSEADWIPEYCTVVGKSGQPA